MVIAFLEKGELENIFRSIHSYHLVLSFTI
uniref:Uncharacterized protein n=1 Tax=Arundo donax TaxID=35708 RepID=A0A0A9DYX8_ARUDO